jgi:hypothetical protein
MHLRARMARPSLHRRLLSHQPMVRAMTHRIYGALVASVGAIALLLAASEAFARSGATPHGAFHSGHSISHRSLAQSLRHHRRNDTGFFWPGDGFYDDGSSNGGEPLADVSQPPSGDIHYTYKYDVPWDWAHRFPPAEHPYVPSCPSENVTVPGHGGEQQTVHITRCY